MSIYGGEEVSNRSFDGDYSDFALVGTMIESNSVKIDRREIMQSWLKQQLDDYIKTRDSLKSLLDLASQSVFELEAKIANNQVEILELTKKNTEYLASVRTPVVTTAPVITGSHEKRSSKKNRMLDARKKYRKI